ADTGLHLMQRLSALQSPWIGEVRGKGLLLAVELVQDKASKRPAGGDQMKAVVAGCAQRGVIVGLSAGSRSGFGNSVILSPTLVLTHQEADRIADVLDEAIAEAFA